MHTHHTDIRDNNRGMSLVLVLVAISLITILATVTLAVATMNFRMKVVNNQSKENFYTAEKVLDEIRLGLQNDVSVALSDAYVKTMAQYADMDNAQRTNYFNNLYISNLRDKIATDANQSLYDITYLEGFLDDDIAVNTTLSAAPAELAVTSDGMTLRNLSVTYVDENDYITRVSTNIKLQIPQMNFSQSSAYPNVLKYSIIANEGVSIAEATADILLNGSVYAGGESDSMVVRQNNKVTLQTGHDLIVKNNLRIENKGTFTGGTRASIWTKDIEAMRGSALNLMGTTYTANDLNIIGGAAVTISGEYYGFGNPIAAAQADANQDAGRIQDIQTNPGNYSSAILINGLGADGDKASINFASGLSKLVLAGNAYIGDGHVLMGESLSVKCNQLAYLVPESYMTTSNPMTDDMKNAQVSLYGSEAQLLDAIEARVNDDYNISGIVQMYSADGFWYYYMQFTDAEAASDYFAQYYAGVEGDILKSYLNMYVDEQAISFDNQRTEKIANGHILCYDERGITSIGDTLTGEQRDISEDSEECAQLINWQNIFSAYNVNLTTNYEVLTNKQLASSVFENLVYSDALFNADLMSGNERVFEYTEKENGVETTYKAYCYKGDVILDDAFLSSANGKNCRCIIATGDVTIKEDFTGTIIAGGKVNVDLTGEAKTELQLSNDVQMVAKIIANGVNRVNRKKYYLQDYLVDSKQYLGRILGSGEDDNSVELEELVIYTNWSKE